ncbi:proteolipid protein DM beta-like isoform X2 [Tubulanus polymorphus]|uniref:proteolipid protein DM beta-like isoform X2 n=1 Tax=Tubulanus polymorphus TaxID=672921 RepID=UPI003DA48653
MGFGFGFGRGYGMGDCCASCCRCLAGIPCRTLTALIMILLGIGGYAGGTVVGFMRVRKLLDHQMYDYLEFIVMGVCIGTGVFGLLFFTLGALSTGWTARHVFNTTKKNACARALNVVGLVIAFILLIGWGATTAVTMTPVVLLTLFYHLHDSGIKCIDMKNYGFPSKVICGSSLRTFTEDSQAVLICFAVAVLAGIILIVALSFFIACMAADYAHLEETKYVTYNTYKSEDKNSQESMLDTKM